MGIGTSSPGFPLSFAPLVGDKISLWSNSGNSYGFGIQSHTLQIHTDVSLADIAFGYGSSASFIETMRIQGNGNVGIGTSTATAKLDVIGSIRCVSLTQTSDSRLKKGIVPLRNSLQKIMQLNGYDYYWKNENDDSSLQTGVLAQEVQKIFPHLVKENNEGILSVNYSGLIPVLIESIKDQQKLIDEIKTQHQKEIVELKTLQQIQIDELRVLVEKLLKLQSKS